MATAVQFDLNPEAARLFQEAGSEVRRRIAFLVSALITQQAKNPRSLVEIMDEMSKQAETNGLNEQKLNELLREA